MLLPKKYLNMLFKGMSPCSDFLSFFYNPSLAQITLVCLHVLVLSNLSESPICGYMSYLVSGISVPQLQPTKDQTMYL